MERTLSPTPSLAERSASRPRLPQLLVTLALWAQRARTRRQLAMLDEHQLADVGISHGERQAELDKPFWR
ncbi:DUF1127 domain-containing protein [Pseudomonas cavernae]|uniref:DUF1127 domain-containing protein n=1 Tax=Pseudomonas cavernae TaxID=2320867 RepID=A0A385YX27_9PSED|nr:DUF1127 domain-containing protein [Pseudomonas cavernae]AYC31001.1 DUF1127 domain-containing protein [Pseudomonas cavernae]